MRKDGWSKMAFVCGVALVCILIVLAVVSFPMRPPIYYIETPETIEETTYILQDDLSYDEKNIVTHEFIPSGQ